MDLPNHYCLNISGVQVKLPLIVSESDNIALYSFNLLGKTRINSLCAEGIFEILLKNEVLNEVDCLVAVEAKSLGLAQELSALMGFDECTIIRKSEKIYMKDPITEIVRSITTANQQLLVLDGNDADLIRGKNVLVIEDVISTEKTITAVKALLKRAGANLYGICCVATEGKKLEKENKYIRLGHIPLYNLDGEMI